MRYVVFGDCQFHPWQEAERPDRWKRMLDVFRYVFRLVDDHAPDSGVIFLGDLFESKRTIRSDVQALVYQRLAKYMNVHTNCRFHFISGNHDQYAGICTQSALRLGERFVMHDGKEASCIDENHKIYALPYGATAPTDLDYNVLCMHQDVRNAQYGTGLKCTETTADESLFLRTGRRKMVLNGHYHVPQRIELSKRHLPIQCAGAPFQHNWNDARYNNVARGIWLLHTDGPRIVQCGLNKFPKFYTDPTDKRIREGVDFYDRPTAVKMDVARTDSPAVASRDPIAFIEEYVYSMERDRSKANTLVRAGLRYMGGETTDVLLS